MLKKNPEHKFFYGAYPLILGHRGAAGIAPENTLPSFARALEEGADIIESDLRLTRDGHIVMIHDPSVDRTTDGSGLVANMTLAEIRELDAGYRFSTDGGQTFPFRGQGIRIPTLQEGFDVFPGIRFNLDLKSRHPALAAKAVELAGRNARAELTLLTTFEYAVQRRIYKAIRQTGTNVATAASRVEVAVAVLAAQCGLPPPKGPLAFEVPRTGYGVRIVTPSFVKNAHKRGLPVFVWTINDPEEMRALLDTGVDGFVTDFPASALSLVNTVRVARQKT